MQNKREEPRWRMLEDPQVGAGSASLLPLVVLIVFLICCPRVPFASSQSFLVAGSLDLWDIFLWMTCSAEGCDYGFVVIKVTSLCWLLPPVSSKAAELGGSSRIQAAVPAASFLTASFQTTPPPHPPSMAACAPADAFKVICHESVLVSQILRRRFSLHALLRVFLEAGIFRIAHPAPVRHHPHAAVASPVCTYAPLPSSLVHLLTSVTACGCVIRGVYNKTPLINNRIGCRQRRRLLLSAGMEQLLSGFSLPGSGRI